MERHSGGTLVPPRIRAVEAQLQPSVIESDSVVVVPTYNEAANLEAVTEAVLAQGVDGIAVGLSTKILPHNFIELCKA